MDTRVLVIGTVFIDCKGFAANVYVPTGRNLGNIEFIHGGVGRNVAENIANLGLQTSFLSSVDASALGQEVITRLEKSGISTAWITQSERNGMGMWLAILDEKGGLAGSISQMPDLSGLEQVISERGHELVREATHIALELDLNASIATNVTRLALTYGKPVYGIPGNLDVVLKHTDLLNGLACFICNNYEAERLLDKPLLVGNPEQIQKELIPFVHESGLKSMVITLGEHGSVYYDAETGDSGIQPAFSVHVIDSSGAGDAFFSGTVSGLARRLPLKEAVVLGTKTAALTLASQENTRLDLKDKLLADEQLQFLYL